jgi:hypothetical protein
MKKLTQFEMLDLVLEDLQSWASNGGDQSDDSLLYALRNGMKLHAANLWLGSGAASDEVVLKTMKLRISHIGEQREIDLIMKNAHIYVCPDCNHHGFYDQDEGASIECFSCSKTATKMGA